MVADDYWSNRVSIFWLLYITPRSTFPEEKRSHSSTAGEFQQRTFRMAE